MVTITTIEKESVYQVEFQELESSRFRNTPPRISKTKTLDGGIVIDHRGFYENDREFEIRAKISDQQLADDLFYIYRNNTLVNLGCREGFFQGAIAFLEEISGEIRLTFLVKE